MKFKYFIILFIFVLGVSSCDKYLDINDDPTRPKDVPLKTLLPTVIEATSGSYYYMGKTSARLSQQLAHYYGYPENVVMSSGWNKIYLKALNNAKDIVEKAEETKATHYAGIAKVLQAMNIGLLTDTWEAAPWKEAVNGSENFFPAYDSQETLYSEIDRLLSEAIALFDSSSDLTPGSDDMIYGGDMEKWKKAAYALKARYAIHLTNKGAETYAGKALDALANGFSSSGDDLQLNYGESLNPYHTGVALSNLTGNYTVTFSEYFINMLNGTNYPGLVDPRLSVIAEIIDPEATEYHGYNSFDESAPSSTVDFTVNTWHSRADAPILMMTYAEQKFIEAEAQLIKGGNALAYDAYLEGIAGNMEKLGVDGSAYLADPQVAVGADNLTLALIMKEKFIATFLNPEGWVDARRHHFSTDVYPNLKKVEDYSDVFVTFQRAWYPSSEFDRNSENVKANKKEVTVLMWRDQ